MVAIWWLVKPDTDNEMKVILSGRRLSDSYIWKHLSEDINHFWNNGNWIRVRIQILQISFTRNGKGSSKDH